MVRRSLFLLTLFAFVLLFSACHEHHDEELRLAYGLAQSQPDSALAMLNRINCQRLNEGDKARYALIYVMAQDKSGLDVDSDTLLHFATAYYASRPDDSLYAKCQYYTGKYYMLNDSTEKALNCFNQAIRAARLQHDTLTQCLALNRASVVLRTFKPALAVSYARTAYNLYNKVKDATDENKCYYLLNIAECLSDRKEKLDESILVTKEATILAKHTRKSYVIADAYQDLSVFYNLEGSHSLALQAIKVAYHLRNTHDLSIKYALADAYYNADSLRQAKEIITTFTKEDYNQKGEAIYFLLRQIAYKSHSYELANKYADSTAMHFEEKRIRDLKSRNEYYSLLSEKDRMRMNEQMKSQEKTYLIIFVIILFTVFTFIMAYLFFQKMKTAKEKQLSNLKQIRRQKRQIAIMRNFLLQKINIKRKLNRLNGHNARLLLSEDDWNELEVFLEISDNEFPTRLKKDFPTLTHNDIRLLMLLRLKIPYPQIASIYHISDKSVQQRLFLLKEKLGIKGAKTSTREFIHNY